MNKNSKLVYSTDVGRIDPAPAEAQIPETDGIVRLQLQTKGRKGKGVTLITGLGLADKDLKPIAKKLKQQCSTGGAVKDGIIEIQGDQRALLKPVLEKMGHTVKLAGG